MSLNNHSEPVPTVVKQQRISDLDLLRGFALFGIFLMNIIAMACPLEAYANPFAFVISDLGNPEDLTWSDGHTLNQILFSLTHIFVDQKMMGLFSLLFGASVMLFLSSLQEKGQSSGYYFKRNGWLLLFGLLHGIFLFIGDILFIYSICAFFLFAFSGMRPALQFSLGIIIYCVPIFIQWYMQLSITEFSIEQLQQLRELWRPSIASLQETMEFEGSASYLERVLTSIGWYEVTEETNTIYDWYWNAITLEAFARAFGMMLIGMSCFNIGVLPNRHKRMTVSFYRKLFIISFVMGLSFVIGGLWLNFSYQWQATSSALGGRILNHIGTPFIVCAYLAMLVLWSNKIGHPLVQKIKENLQAVGRMTFTNYIMQSIIGLYLFTGVGFGLYGQLNRLELFMTVMIVCLLQLCFSGYWLKRFRYGPLEWLWRCLTYTQVMKLTR